jgi:isoleucyl-tRNA synthetase
VLWSVVEKTALAEAEIEYHDHVSDTIHVAFPVLKSAGGKLDGSSVVIWTTTPWTIPGNRALAYGPEIAYALVEVETVAEGGKARVGDRMVLAKELVAATAEAGKFTAKVLADVTAADLEGLIAAHPLRGQGYDFDVRLLAGDFVTADAGTGFVHIAPGHGADDYELGVANGVEVPDTVAEDGSYYPHVPMFAGKRVYTAEGKKGDANRTVIAALDSTGKLLASGRITHSYPHSWRSKAPVIFRNAPQWFIAMDRPIPEIGGTLREKALAAIDATRFVPPAGYNRLRSMIETRPDWCVSRQRAWGVPIAVFVDKASGEPLRDAEVMGRVVEAFKVEGADAWFDSPPERFLGNKYNVADFEQVTDILDVWFDSGCTHVFTLEGNPDLKWPADLYLEGSDQHRGWFHSSLLESCGTRGRAPYDGVLTHGFTLDEQGRKMSKSLGNITAPQTVCDQYGADILRLWVVGTDYTEDQRIGPEILKHQAEAYRRLRNTLRYLLGSLDGYSATEKVAHADMPELDRWVLHRLAELDVLFRQAVDDFDFHTIATELHNFCAVDLSAFYFDIRKDAIYCDTGGALRRRAARTVMAEVFSFLTAWLAPITCFTAEEAWLARPNDMPDGGADSVHLRVYPAIPAAWLDPGLGEKWKTVRTLRRVVTGALELERAEKRIGSSLQAAPHVHAGSAFIEALKGLDLVEICITSGGDLIEVPDGGVLPAGAFTLPDVAGVAVVPAPAGGQKCARCWQVLEEVGKSAAHPLLCLRCEGAVTA